VINISGRGFSGAFNSPILFDGVRYPGWQVTPRLTLSYQQVEALRGPAALTAGQVGSAEAPPMQRTRCICPVARRSMV
jgi:iron complex outermembrane receptor protein